MFSSFLFGLVCGVIYMYVGRAIVLFYYDMIDKYGGFDNHKTDMETLVAILIWPVCIFGYVFVSVVCFIVLDIVYVRKVFENIYNNRDKIFPKYFD